MAVDASEFRAAMPVAQKWAYFDHAAVAPLPRAAQLAIHRWATDAAEQGDTVWPNWTAQVEACRTAAARLLNAPREQIALVHSTTAGVNIVAEGYPWQSGDNIVIPDDEFPTNVYPWLNLAARGVETRRIASDRPQTVNIERLLAACDARTKLISVSWVGYSSGWRIDVAELVEQAHRRGILVFLDAIQGLGVFPLDVTDIPVDFVAADGHKWLLGPEGAGLFYLRPEHLELLHPTGVGWHSVAQASDYGRLKTNWRPDAARFEGGTQNMVGFIGLGASLELLLQFGPAAIAQRLLDYTDEAVRQLTAAGATIRSQRERPEHNSGIVSFEMPGHDPQHVRKQCLAAGAVLACRNQMLRLAPHAYQNEADLTRLTTALRTL